MKNIKFLIVLAIVVVLSGCEEIGSSGRGSLVQADPENQQTQSHVIVDDGPHVHQYAENIDLEPTCTTEGVRRFTCSCGDTYTEIIPIQHQVEKWTYNDDATHTSNATRTGICTICGEEVTEEIEGTMLMYTYEDMELTMFATGLVNIYSLPSEEGNTVGTLSPGSEVKVTAKADTGWYRIFFNGGMAYVSESSLSPVPLDAEGNISRVASDYRAISDFSSLGVGAGLEADFENLRTGHEGIEKLAFTYNGVTILVYNYTWYDAAGIQYILLYDFTNSGMPYVRISVNDPNSNVYQMIDAGGIQTGAGLVPLSNYRVY